MKSGTRRKNYIKAYNFCKRATSSEGNSKQHDNSPLCNYPTHYKERNEVFVNLPNLHIFISTLTILPLLCPVELMLALYPISLQSLAYYRAYCYMPDLKTSGDYISAGV